MGSYLSTPVETIIPKSVSIGTNTEVKEEISIETIHKVEVKEEVKVVEVEEVVEVKEEEVKVEEVEEVKVEEVEEVTSIETINKVEIAPVEVFTTDVVKKRKRKNKRVSPAICECGNCGFCKNKLIMDVTIQDYVNNLK